MKQARATDEEVEKLVWWFNNLADAVSINDEDRILDFAKNYPVWERTIFGYQVLVDNCADKSKDYLDWKPEIKENMGYE